MSEQFDPEAGQPLPVTAENSTDVAIRVAEAIKQFGYPEIAEDVEDRIRIGERKYGKRLQSFNGRDVFKDLYDEVLDALNYAKQAEIEGLDDGGLFDQISVLATKVKEVFSLTVCSLCGNTRIEDEFYAKASNKGGKDYRCKECVSQYFHDRRQQKKQQGLCGCGKQPQEGYLVCADCLDKRHEYSRKLKQDAIDAYGSKCQCPCGCDASEFEYITIDHLAGGGAQHRKEIGGGYHFYKWLRKNNYPSGYQTLCWNCNCSKGMYGFCPREIGRTHAKLNDPR